MYYNYSFPRKNYSNCIKLIIKRNGTLTHIYTTDVHEIRKLLINDYTNKIQNGEFAAYTPRDIIVNL